MRYECRTETADKTRVQELSKRYSLHPALTQLLLARGVTTDEEMRRFLQPSLSDLYDPFSLSGMREAADRVRQAIEAGETVVIYGDYDADGVSATAALYLFLTGKGLTVNCYIPERAKGYGISEEAVEFIMEEFAPDLIITVDCGIANRAEIEYIYDLGGEVIVTDHHQPGELLPECIVVDPHLAGETYPYRFLCGAGVVLKLIQALEPDAVERYIDIAALATVADSVPLTGENRTIVTLGLARMEREPRPCFTAYRHCRELDEAMTAEDVAYYLAPCINAAGRLAEAALAFDFLVAEEEEHCEALCRQLLALNEERKKLCREAMQRVTAQISRRKQFTGRLISAIDDGVSSGIAGIVASQLTEAYRRPAFLFCREGTLLKGSGRGIPGVDLFAMLSTMQDLFTAFGGHTQAAGVTMEEENYKAFCKRCEEYLARVDVGAFLKTAVYDLEFREEYCKLDFLREIEKLEPYGFGFERPVFRLTSDSFSYESLAKHPQYLRIATSVPTFSPMCFCGDAVADILDSRYKKTLLFGLKTDSFRGEQRVSASVRRAYFAFDEAKLDEETGKARYLEQLYYPMTGPKDSHVSLAGESFVQALDEALASLYGTLIVCNTAEGYRYFSKAIAPELKNAANVLDVGHVRPIGIASQNTLLLSAGANLDYAGYTEVFFVERPLNPYFVSSIVEKYETNATCLADGPVTYSFVKDIDLSRECFARYFRMVKNADRGNTVQMDYYRWYRFFRASAPDIDLAQFITCMFVFNDLGFFRLERDTGRLLYDASKTGDITASKFYQRVKAVQDSLL